MLTEIYNKKIIECANDALKGLDLELQKKYKYNIDQAYRIIKEQIAFEATRYNKAKEAIDTQILKRNQEELKIDIPNEGEELSFVGQVATSCANANDQPKNVEQALFILGLGTIDELLSQNANELLDNAYKNKTDACAKYVGFDKVSQNKYKYNIDQAYHIIKEQIALARRPEQSSSSGASVETNQTSKVIYPIISDDAGSNSSRARSDTAISMSTLTNSATSSQNSSRNSSFSTIGSNQGQGPVQGQGQKPVHDPVSGPEISETEFNQAIVAIKHLFNMKTINDLKLSNVTIKKDNLLKKIAENRPQDKDQITNIINEAFNFYKFAHEFKSSIPFTEIRMFRDYISYKYINSTNKNLLKQIYDNFYDKYKTLGFSNSNIYLKPNSNNNQTRKNQSNILCDKISQLIQPMYSNRTIPSQIPNLTKRNITKKVVKDETKRVKDANDKATAEAKEKEEANKERENARKELNTSLEQVKKNMNTKETDAIRRNIAELTNKLSGNVSVSEIHKINKEIAKLEGMLKSGVKGGTRKQRKQIQIANRKKKKETRKK